jgi:hypothetical protein
MQSAALLWRCEAMIRRTGEGGAMKNQARNARLALRKETIRELDSLELSNAAGGSIVIPPSTGCPTHRICLTTTTNTTL